MYMGLDKLFEGLSISAKGMFIRAPISGGREEGEASLDSGEVSKTFHITVNITIFKPGFSMFSKFSLKNLPFFLKFQSYSNFTRKI